MSSPASPSLVPPSSSSSSSSSPSSSSSSSSSFYSYSSLLVCSIFESDQIVHYFSQFLSLEDLLSLEMTSKGVYQNMNVNIPNFWREVATRKPYLTDWTVIQQCASEKAMIKKLDKNYRKILVASEEEEASVEWLTSRLLLFPYSIGILIATFDRLWEITHTATKTCSFFQEEFDIKEASLQNMMRVHATTCFTEVLNTLSKYPKYAPIQRSGLMLLIVLLRPIHGEVIISSRLGLRKLIDDSQVANYVLHIAPFHMNDDKVMELLLKVCTNLDQYRTQKCYLLENGVFEIISTSMQRHSQRSSVQLAGLGAYRNFLHGDFSSLTTEPYHVLDSVMEVCINACSLHYMYEHYEIGQGYSVDSTIMNLVQHLTLYSHHKISMDDMKLKTLLEMVYFRYSDVDEILHIMPSAITMTLLAIDVMKRCTSTSTSTSTIRNK